MGAPIRSAAQHGAYRRRIPKEAEMAVAFVVLLVLAGLFVLSLAMN
jgi:hypothetical protein